MSADVPERLGYRPGLDGIRALAIVFVMASHAHPSLLKGGELGVDVFFALSGFSKKYSGLTVATGSFASTFAEGFDSSLRCTQCCSLW